MKTQSGARVVQARTYDGRNVTLQWEDLSDSFDPASWTTRLTINGEVVLSQVAKTGEHDAHERMATDFSTLQKRGIDPNSFADPVAVAFR